MGVITQLMKQAGFQEMNKYNESHDERGRFSSGGSEVQETDDKDLSRIDNRKPDHVVSTGYGPEHATELHIHHVTGDGGKKETIVEISGEAQNADPYKYSGHVKPETVLSRYKGMMSED